MKRTPTTREEALALIAKRTKSKEIGSEESLQAACVRWFAEKYPEKRGRLFATFQNPSIEQYGQWVAKGFVPGVADLIFINNDFRIIGIEMKHSAKSHSKDHILRQCEWLLHNCYRGYFCNSIEMFEKIIDGTGEGIDPRKIMEKLSTKKTICFDMLLSL
jgi:hypothetical protein